MTSPSLFQIAILVSVCVVLVAGRGGGQGKGKPSCLKGKMSDGNRELGV